MAIVGIAVNNLSTSVTAGANDTGPVVTTIHTSWIVLNTVKNLDIQLAQSDL